MTASGWLDEFVSAAAVAWLSTPENITALAAGDADWAARSAQAEVRVTELQARLDEAVDQYAAGGISFASLSRIEAALLPQIRDAQKEAMPLIVDDGIRMLMTAADVQTAWDGIGLVEKRRILKLLFEVRILQAPRRGPNNVQPERVIISPRIPRQSSATDVRELA